MENENQANSEDTKTMESQGDITPEQIETRSMIQQADSVAKRMEEANRKAEELLQRQESIAARMMLSGKADAGQIKKSESEETEEKINKQVEDALKLYR